MKKQIREFLIRLIRRNSKNKKINDNIPDEIMTLFGKFYFYSFAYILLFSLFYPLFIISNVSNISLILSYIIFIGLYIFIIVDTLKKSKGFKSVIFLLLILLVVLSVSFSIVKIFI